MDPFAMALDAMFAAPGSAEAVYRPISGGEVAIRVIRSRPDQSLPFGGGNIVQATNSFQVRVVDAPTLRSGEQITLDGQPYRLVGTPMIDVEGLTWTAGAEPVK